MIESMLEPHLKRQAGASQTEVGLTFLVLGGVYMLSSPVCGFVSIVHFLLNININFGISYSSLRDGNIPYNFHHILR